MLYAVIMAGGSGTRLWPLSRQNHPKQALRLVGERTMFQHAVDRLTPLFPSEQTLVVTRSEHAPILAAQVPELKPSNFIIEPEGRGTAPAIGLAAIHLQKRDPDAVMAVLTADHYITDTEEFRKALSASSLLAKEGHLVTLGIPPESPSTGFGYIQQGESLGNYGGLPTFRVERFIEKPDLEKATWMVESGGFAWNSGMFVWRVDRIMGEIQKQMPGLYAKLMELSAAIDKPEYEDVIKALWHKVEKQTIDYGVMESAEDVAVIPVNIGWTDIGSWRSLFNLLAVDQNRNSWTGPHIDLDTEDTLVINDKRLVATIGVKGMIIIDTGDALLVCPKEREQDVREIVKELKEKGKDNWL